MSALLKIISKVLSLGVMFAGLLSILIVFILFINNSRSLSRYQLALKNLSSKNQLFTPNEKEEIMAEAMRRIDVYEQQIEKAHLLDGLVINRTLDGMALSECDSLLFSSIRFVALNKVGKKNKASKAWRSILKSKGVGGKWLRHPKCQEYSSRDMIIGLLAALSQYPKGSLREITELLSYLDKNHGFFSHGPINVSFLTPGVGELLRQLSLANGLPESTLPLAVQSGFSTMEFNSLYLEKGYSSHLVALLVWLEMEIKSKSQVELRGTRSPLWEVSNNLSYMTLEDLYGQRLNWVTKKLVEVDSRNLFYRWLNLKSNDALNENKNYELLKELVTAPQFPKNHLPLDCDRKADYLWQRDSDEYDPFSIKCSKQFNGIDYLWMASLLIDEIKNPSILSQKVAH